MKQSAVRARIRQLCCLGLPGELLMSSLLPALRELVPSDSAAFFWVDSRGEMRNLYAERLWSVSDKEPSVGASNLSMGVEKLRSRWHQSSTVDTE